MVRPTNKDAEEQALVQVLEALQEVEILAAAVESIEAMVQEILVLEALEAMEAIFRP